MTSMYVIITMVVVGALIGGITNSIAIKMLFRPYKAIYIGKFRVPFTPGLIPKRRAELADQLGKLVVNHLLTVEGLQQKLSSSVFITEMTEWLNKEVTKVLRSDDQVITLMEKWLGVKDGKEKLENQVETWLSFKSEQLLIELRPLPIKDVLPKKLNDKVDQFIPEFTSLFLEKGKAYFNSKEGIEGLTQMVDRFLMGKGTLGSMVSMFLSQDQLVAKLQPEIIKMLNDKGTHELIEVFIKKEWTKLKEQKVEQIEEKINLVELTLFVQKKIKDHIPLHYLELPLCQWTSKYEPMVIELIPGVVIKIGQATSNELAHLFRKLKLEEVVRNQVEQFPVKRLEDIVLSISRSELKLITYLGGLLGGIIGLLQGIFILLLR